MIERYEIKINNNEQILLIYLNYSYEFGNLDNNIFYNLKDNIKRYIAKLKIKFNGTKVLLVVGGISLATIYLSPTDIKEIEKMNINYTSSSIVEKILETNDNVEIKEKIEELEIIEPKEEIIITQNNNIEVNNQNNNVINNVVETNNNSTPVTENNTTNNNIAKTPPIEVKEMVKIYRSNGTVAELPFEEYIVGVVAAEMPASFPIEALKAQAVVARTYARLRLSKGLTLTDSVSTQVYKDNIQLQSMWGSNYEYYYSKVKEAVDTTKDIEIYYNGNYIDAVYHSTSNGYTEDASYVWGNDIPYLKSVSSPWDISATTYLRTEEKSNEVLFSILGLQNLEPSNVEIINRNNSGRITEVRIGEDIYDGVTLRNILGLRSADFDLEVVDGNLIITTRGYGHGVGMSQYGAAGMAREGYSYIQILKHYYTGVSIY